MSDPTPTDDPKKNPKTSDENKTPENPEGKPEEGKPKDDKPEEGKPEEGKPEEGKKTPESRKPDLLGDDPINKPADEFKVPERYVGENDQETILNLEKARAGLEKGFSGRNQPPEDYTAPFGFFKDKERFGEFAFEDISEAGVVPKIVGVLEKLGASAVIVKGVAEAAEEEFAERVNEIKESEKEQMKLIGSTPEERKRYVDGFNEGLSNLPIDDDMKTFFRDRARHDPAFLRAFAVLSLQLAGNNNSHELSLAVMNDSDESLTDENMLAAAGSVQDGTLSREDFKKMQDRRNLLRHKAQKEAKQSVRLPPL